MLRSANRPWIWFLRISRVSKEMSTMEGGSANICRVRLRERHALHEPAGKCLLEKFVDIRIGRLSRADDGVSELAELGSA